MLIKTQMYQMYIRSVTFVGSGFSLQVSSTRPRLCRKTQIPFAYCLILNLAAYDTVANQV